METKLKPGCALGFSDYRIFACESPTGSSTDSLGQRPETTVWTFADSRAVEKFRGRTATPFRNSAQGCQSEAAATLGPGQHPESSLKGLRTVPDLLQRSIFVVADPQVGTTLRFGQPGALLRNGFAVEGCLRIRPAGS